MNFGIMHNEKFLFLVQNVGSSDSAILKIDVPTGSLIKALKLTSYDLTLSSCYSHLLFDSSNTYFYMRSNTYQHTLSYNIDADTFKLLDNTPNMFALEVGDGSNTLLYGGYVSSCRFDIGQINFNTESATYRSLTFGGS
jgi:hypothetical protein